MATFAELKRQVSLRLDDENNTAVSSADVGDCINQALKYWKPEKYWFNQSRATFNTVVGDSVLPITGFQYLVPDYGIRLTNQNYVYTLTKSEPMYFTDTVSRGRPYRYAWDGGVYYLYWIPDAVYPITAVGVKDYLPLANDTDENDFTTHADQLLVFEAVSRGWSIRQDMDKSAQYAAAAQDESRVLKKRTSNTEATGTMTIYEPTPTYQGDYLC